MAAPMMTGSAACAGAKAMLSPRAVPASKAAIENVLFMFLSPCLYAFLR
jgi:hypothetical protein